MSQITRLVFRESGSHETNNYATLSCTVITTKFNSRFSEENLLKRGKIKGENILCKLVKF